MTLRSQIFLALSTIFLAVVALILLVSLGGTRSYLQNQLATHAQETATALSVTLAPSVGKGEIVIADAQILSVFDRGYFKQITLFGADKQPVITKVLPERIEGVPAWFIKVLPINTPAGEAFLSAGWRQLGKVAVVSQPTFAYQHLWSNSLELVLWLGGLYFVALALAWWMLNLVLRPLDSIEKTAVAIQAKRFEPIELMPKAPELRRVISAMNMMSKRVREMLEAETQKAIKFQKEAYEDEFTGFANRRGYEIRLSDLLTGQHQFTLGGIVSVELDDIRLIYRSSGFPAVATILNKLVQCANATFAGYDGSILARSNEFSFSFVVTDLTEEEIVGLSAKLKKSYIESLAHEPASAEIGVQIGVAFFTKDEPRSNVFAKADLAVETARQKSRNGYHILENTNNANTTLGSTGWRSLIQSALVEKRWKLVQQPVQSLAPDGVILQGECMARLVDARGELVPASNFMPMAARHKLMPDVDKAMFSLAVEHLQQSPDSQALVAINISPQSMVNHEFVQWLEVKLREGGFNCNRMAIEIAEFGVVRNQSAATTLRNLIRKYGGKFGMDHFGLDPKALQILRDIVPDYVKLSGALIDDLEHTEAVSHMLESFVSLAHSLDILVVAQQVERHTQVVVLRSAKVDAGQGYLFGAPK